MSAGTGSDSWARLLSISFLLPLDVTLVLGLDLDLLDHLGGSEPSPAPGRLIRLA
jgi:hypothetical protein